PNAYIVVEKILELEEELPSYWPVEGTTGYEFMNFLNGIFVQTKNQRAITSSYQRFTKEIRSFEEIVHEKKRLIIQARMAGDVERLSFIIEAISSRDRNGVDITMHGIKKALEEILTYFPIYRTYIDENRFSKRDKKYLDEIIEKVKEQNPSLTDEFNYIGNLLTLNFGEHFSKEQSADTYDFIKKFQQLTGPLMAKGFEDTALYVYNRFLSLNEVGGNPGKFGMNIKEFHNFNKARSAKWPHTMNGSSTHDTKLSEDVRARINAISEFAQEWDANIKSWNKINQIQKKKINGRYVPDNNEEYRIYQILLGSFPQDAAEHEEYLQRIKEYIVKSLREAKLHSAWIKPNAEYESAAKLFAEAILKNPADNKFLTSFMQFKNKIAFYGMFNSLSQVLLKAASPGLPDFYQGTDLWNFSLVDPDNRRPVDYEKKNKFLDEIVNIKSEETSSFIEKMFDNLENGQIKLFLTYKCLQARKQHSDLFQHGNYVPLYAGGALSENIAAFVRTHENKTAVVIALRFYSALIKPGSRNIDPEIFKDTYIELPEEFNYTNIITSETVDAKREVPLSLILAKFPGALLIGEK
ncbi:MAG TPA: malto-oligosyltrehalose synthase, partial [Ignavibacteriales bacterium]|nr:malto-oligosyltrehalose synthase [Ignavibacteriales bacterium]